LVKQTSVEQLYGNVIIPRAQNDQSKSKRCWPDVMHTLYILLWANAITSAEIGKQHRRSKVHPYGTTAKLKH